MIFQLFNFDVVLSKALTFFISISLLEANFYDCSFIKRANYHFSAYYSTKVNRFFPKFYGKLIYEIDVKM